MNPRPQRRLHLIWSGCSALRLLERLLHNSVVYHCFLCEDLFNQTVVQESKKLKSGAKPGTFFCYIVLDVSTTYRFSCHY